MSSQLFITVKYGDNKQLLFNPHCRSLLLIECIREKCNCGSTDHLDLVDEQGNVSNISDKDNLSEYASQFLEGRRIYVLIKIIKAESDRDKNKYEPLLQNMEKLYPELSEILDRKSRPAQVTPKGKQLYGNKKKLNALSHSKLKSAKRSSIR